jgi:hypothetical protein
MLIPPAAMELSEQWAARLTVSLGGYMGRFDLVRPVLVL